MNQSPEAMLSQLTGLLQTSQQDAAQARAGNQELSQALTVAVQALTQAVRELTIALQVQRV